MRTSPRLPPGLFLCAGDIKKAKEGGMHTCECLVMTTKKVRTGDSSSTWWPGDDHTGVCMTLHSVIECVCLVADTMDALL